MFDYEMVEAGLVALHRDASRFEGWARDLVGRMIGAGEYRLALDELSYAYLNNDEPMPADLFAVFERLAVEMDMEGDPGCAAVAELRAKMKARADSGRAPA